VCRLPGLVEGVRVAAAACRLAIVTIALDIRALRYHAKRCGTPLTLCGECLRHGSEHGRMGHGFEDL
jgi:hypothetical protein